MAIDAVGIQAQMRQNAAINYPRLARLGLLGDKVPVITCGGCGHMESAVFWTPVLDLGNTLHLRCPACGAGGVRYDLDRNEVRQGAPRNRLLVAASVALAMLAGALAVGATQTRADLDDLRMWAAETRAELFGFALGTPGEAIYLATGNRETEIRRYLQQIAGSSTRERTVIHSVRHLPELDQTRLILSHETPALRSWLAACGWQRADAGVQPPTKTPDHCSATAVARRE